jgi:very-short-patch-repair endonuclease
LVNAESGDRYDVEVDGDIHLSANAVAHDERRDAFVKSKGLKILRFSARDVINKPEVIKDRLLRV